MPPLTTATVVVPHLCQENVVTSVETRVLGNTLTTHPRLTQIPQPREHLRLAVYPDPNHPFGAQKTVEYLKSLNQCWQLNLTWELTQLPGSSRTQVPQMPDEFLWSVQDASCGSTPETSRRNLPVLARTMTRYATAWRTGTTGQRTSRWDTLPRHSVRARKPPPRDTPLRELVEEFMGTQQMAWLREVVEPMPFEQWVKRYPVARQAELRAARDSVDQVGICEKDAAVRNFLKLETTDKFTDPRNISPRPDAFLALVGPYIAAIERAAHHAPFLVKGKKPAQRVKGLEWLEEYSHYVEVDYTRFDQTINEHILSALELRVLTAAFPRSEHPAFNEAMRLTLMTSGSSDYGVAYKRRGGRCSGDAHTSIGNGLLNCFLTWVCLRQHDGMWKSVHEGDDGIIAFRGIEPDVVMDDLNFLSVLGFQAKLKCTTALSEVIFCGRRFIASTKGLRDIADVTRTLKKFHASMSVGDPKCLLLAKAMSYNCTDSDTPVIGALSEAIIGVLKPQVHMGSRKMRRALADTARSRWLFGDNSPSVWSDYSPRVADPCPEAYAAVVMYEDLDYHQIRCMEAEFRSWVKKGHIPSKVPQLLVDPTVEPIGVAMYGDIYPKV